MGPRVLLTTDVVGGVWDFCLTLARELPAEVTMLALGEPSRSQIDQASDAAVRLLSAPVKLEWMQDCQRDVARTREIVARHVRDVRPDVLHANHFAAACAEVDIPVVLTLHSDVLSWRCWTIGSRSIPDEWSAYTGLVREALSRAGRIVAVSHFLAQQTRELYACTRDIQVIHNGWPTESLARPGERAKVTLVAGRIWDAAKNVTLVADAAQGWQPGSLYLAGEVTSPDSGERIDVPAPIQARGFLSRTELDAAFRAAAIYISPARYDPFGLLPLQAALNGCPLLLSDIPSYRELWDGVATFFRSDDAADLRRQWSRLLDTPDVARDLARAARNRAVERYSAKRMADAYSHLYASVGALAV